MEKKPEGVETKWVRVKDFMRDAFQYNDLNFFLEEVLTHAWMFDGGVFDLTDDPSEHSINRFDKAAPWRTDVFYPILPESNDLLIKVRVDEDGIDLNAKSVLTLKITLGLVPERMNGYEYDEIIYHKTPKWSYWNFLEYWAPREAALLLFEEEPYEKRDVPTWGKLCVPTSDIDRLIDAIERAFSTGGIKGFHENTRIGLYPYSFIEWAEKKGFAIPADMKIKVTEDAITEETTNELSGKEKREFGSLQNEKEKWDKSIEAAVHAACFFRGEEIKRAKLWDMLAKFDLPESTHERIWKALRKEGLTKKAGRSKKT